MCFEYLRKSYRNTEGDSVAVSAIVISSLSILLQCISLPTRYWWQSVKLKVHSGLFEYCDLKNCHSVTYSTWLFNIDNGGFRDSPNSEGVSSSYFSRLIIIAVGFAISSMGYNYFGYFKRSWRRLLFILSGIFSSTACAMFLIPHFGFVTSFLRPPLDIIPGYSYYFGVTAALLTFAHTVLSFIVACLADFKPSPESERRRISEQVERSCNRSYAYPVQAGYNYKDTGPALKPGEFPGFRQNVPLQDIITNRQ